MAIWGYTQGGVNYATKLFFITLLLAFMEVSFSFDNAVVNASILKTWNHYWQMIFLTVGMLIAVFGMRLLFPLLIVSYTADVSMNMVWYVAIHNPVEYSILLTKHHGEISAFGGMFLLLVFLNFLIDKEKTLHWFPFIEKELSRLGRIHTLPTLISLFVLVNVIFGVSEKHQFATLFAGVWGILIFLGVKILGELLESKHEEKYLALNSARN